MSSSSIVPAMYCARPLMANQFVQWVGDGTLHVLYNQPVPHPKGVLRRLYRAAVVLRVETCIQAFPQAFVIISGCFRELI
jgi:hypothetical protein